MSEMSHNFAPQSLSDLMDRACDAAEAFSAVRDEDSPRFDQLDRAAAVAEAQLRIALANVGIDKARLDRALRLGVIW